MGIQGLIDLLNCWILFKCWIVYTIYTCWFTM